MVERTNNSRRAQRANTTLPYARPSALKRANQPKSGFFATVSNLFSSFWRTDNQAVVRPSSSVESVEQRPGRPAEALVERGEEILASTSTVSQINATNNVLPPPPRAQPQRSPPTAMPPPPPPAALTPSPPGPPRSKSLSSSPDDRSNKIDIVTTFLLQNRRTFNEMETQGMVSLLQEVKEPDADKREPFRFTTSERYNTPGPSTQVQRPPRQLTTNPNGNYVWRGAGSAKPKNRYKSAGFPPPRKPTVSMKLSPAKPKADGKRRKIDDGPSDSNAEAGPSSLVDTTPQANGHTSSPDRSKRSIVSSPSHHPERSTSPTTQATPPKLSSAGTAPASTSRLRINGIQKPTTPVNPSPLRQTWGQSEPPSPPPPSNPTHAATFLSGLVEETAPPPVAPHQNPYEPAYVGRKADSKSRKLLSKRRSAAAIGKTAEDSKAKVEPPKKPEADLSPQKIIEATLPAGAKRSRPPPDIGKQREQPLAEPSLRAGRRARPPVPSSSFTNGLSGLSGSTPTIEEVPDEDEPALKKSKPNGTAVLQPAAEIPERSAPTVVQPTEQEPTPRSKPSSAAVQPSQAVEPSSSLPTPPSVNPFAPALGPKTVFGAKSSAPKAPSKLRYSIQAESDSPKESGKSLPNVGSGPSSPTPAARSSPATAAASNPFTASVPSTSAPAPSVTQGSTPRSSAEIRTFVNMLPESELPRYTFDFPLSSPGAGPSTERARAAASAVPVSSLPTFDFTASASSSAPTTSGSATSSVTASAIGGFNWAAAGMKVPSKPAENWDCPVCGLSNPPSATSKCTVCEAAKPGASTPATSSPSPPVVPPAPPTTGFNWGAAGLKAPTKPADNWDCSVCGLSNPPTATSKCTVCEAAKPGASTPATSSPSPPIAAPAPPATGFNWGAAGLKAPTKPADNWDCSVCGLSNPPTATSKCTVCEAAKPGASTPATSSPSPPVVPPAPPTTGFNWGAAGLKAPTKPAENWDCSVCGLSNPPTATSKCTVCEAAKPGASTPTTSSPSPPIAAPAPPTTGFNWGAAGLKAPTKPAENWDCPMCGLSNPPTATTKCTICEADKPGAKSSTPPVPVSAPTPLAVPTGGFNWAAAGMAAPAVSKGWTCSTCMLNNPDSATKCTVCDTPR